MLSYPFAKLKGADIMCPGLTSPGATIHDEVDEDCPVVSHLEGLKVIFITSVDDAYLENVVHSFQY